MVTGLSTATAPIGNGQNESTKFNEALYYGGCAGILRTKHLIAETGDYMLMVEFHAAIVAFNNFNGATPENQFSNAIEGITAFQIWVEEYHWSYTPPQYYTAKEFTMTFTMQAASGTISVGMVCELNEGCELPIALAQAKLQLQTAVSEAFPSAPQQPHSTTPAQTVTSQQNPPAGDTFEILALRVENKDGQLQYRLIPKSGNWQRYGIALYKDVASQFNIILPDFPGDYPMSGKMKIEYKDNGKPSRVLAVAP